MKKELILELFEKFEKACYIFNDVECWNARELQVIFNYKQWRNFFNAIAKAKDACTNAGEKITDHFADISKTISVPICNYSL